MPDTTADTTDDFKARIDADLKASLLGGDKERASVLRGLKSVILYAEVAQGVRESGLPDDQIQSILSKEAKKRQESADLYSKGGSQEMADKELSEKTIIEEYLPKQLTENEIRDLVNAVATEQGGITKQTMGAAIAAVKQQSGGAADGALVARLVKERIS